MFASGLTSPFLSLIERVELLVWAPVDAVMLLPMFFVMLVVDSWRCQRSDGLASDIQWRSHCMNYHCHRPHHRNCQQSRQRKLCCGVFYSVLTRLVISHMWRNHTYGRCCCWRSHTHALPAAQYESSAVYLRVFGVCVCVCRQWYVRRMCVLLLYKHAGSRPMANQHSNSRIKQNWF